MSLDYAEVNKQLDKNVEETKRKLMGNNKYKPNINKLYLAHPIKIRHDIRKMELEFEKNTGIELVNPFYDKKGNGAEREDIKQIDNAARTAWSGELPYEEIVENDLFSINDADGIIAWAEKTVGSIGTYMEIWECFKLGKKVFIISPDWQNHPWLKYCAIKSGGGIFSSFRELEKYIIGI